MKRILVILILLAVAGFSFAASATATQNIDIVIGQVLLVAIVPTVNPITLTNGAAAAGAQLSGDTDASTRLRYTVSSAAVCRVTAGLSVAAPAGTRLDLTATMGTGGSGAGAQGTSAGVKTLTLVATDIITAIPSCYTGTNVGDGALLTYDLAITGSPADGTTSTVVTLTLQDF